MQTCLSYRHNACEHLQPMYFTCYGSVKNKAAKMCCQMLLNGKMARRTCLGSMSSNLTYRSSDMMMRTESNMN